MTESRQLIAFKSMQGAENQNCRLFLGACYWIYGLSTQIGIWLVHACIHVTFWLRRWLRSLPKTYRDKLPNKNHCYHYSQTTKSKRFATVVFFWRSFRNLHQSITCARKCVFCNNHGLKKLSRWTAAASSSKESTIHPRQLPWPSENPFFFKTSFLQQPPAKKTPFEPLQQPAKKTHSFCNEPWK